MGTTAQSGSAVKNHGNRCGHRPDDPRFLVLGLAKPHWAIGELHAATAAVYTERAEIRGRRRWRARWRGLFHTRGVRSERAEAMAAVLQYFVKHLRLSDLRVVDGRDPHGARGVSVVELARAAGLSASRVAGALHDLTALGWIRGVQRRPRRPDGGHDNEIKQRWLTYGFFRWLGRGILRMVNHARGKPATHGADTWTAAPGGVRPMVMTLARQAAQPMGP